MPFDMTGFKAQATRDQAAGNGAEDYYVKNAEAFDPQKAVNTYAQGAFNSLKTQWGQLLPRLRSGQVATGRLRTGYAGQDEDRILTSLGSDLNDRISQQAVIASGQQLNNLQGIGAYGQATTDRYLDNEAGQRDYATEQQNAHTAKVLGFINAGANLIKGVSSLFSPIHL